MNLRPWIAVSSLCALAACEATAPARPATAAVSEPQVTGQPGIPAITPRNAGPAAAVLPKCVQKLDETNLASDEIPAQVPTGFARLPAWNTEPPLPQWLAREGRPLQVVRTRAQNLGGASFSVFVADRIHHQIVVVDAETLQATATLALHGEPGQLAVDARACGTGGVATIWVTLPHNDEIAVIEASQPPAISYRKVEGQPVAIALAAPQYPQLVESVELVAIGTANPPQVILQTAAGQTVHVAPLPGPPVALRGPLVTQMLALLQSGPPVAVAPQWTEKDYGDVKATLLHTLPLRTLNPAHARMGVLGQTFKPLSPGPARAAACDLQRCFVAHTLLANGVVPNQPAATSSYGSAGVSAPDLCKALPLRPLEVAVSELGRKAVDLKPVGVADAVRDPATQRNYLAAFDRPADAVLLAHAQVLAVAMAGTGNALLLALGGADPMAMPVGEAVFGPEVEALVESPPLAGAPPRLFALTDFGTVLRRVPLQPLADAVAQYGAWTELSAPVRLLPDGQLPLAADPLPAKLRRGRQLFFQRGTAAGLAKAERFACASCHSDGDSDGMVWSSPNGPRNTLALRGRVAGSAPYGWGGEEPLLTDHIGNTIDRLQGSGLPAADVQALADYLNAMPAPVAQQVPLSPAAQRGKELFFSAATQCATCHQPPLYLDGKPHNVGTGKVLDTPSLLGLPRTAPYLHDGRAETLWDVLSQTGESMGHTVQLGDGEKGDLVAFLMGL